MVTTGEYSIRAMKRSDLDLAMDWAEREGWNPGLHDADCFFAIDPNGFFLGELDGEPVASISAVSYGDFAFIGFYMVRPEYRGHGFGLRLWETALAGLGHRNVGLEGMPPQREKYRQYGFRMDYRNIRFEGRAGGAVPDAAGIVPLAQVPLAELLAFDQEVFPAPRQGFLQCWLNMPGSTALAWAPEGTLAGYGMIRPSRQGYRIGPLFAHSPAGANALFDALCARAPGQAVFLDVPEPNTEAMKLAQTHAMTPGLETLRMYTREKPETPLEWVYGVTTLEVG